MTLLSPLLSASVRPTPLARRARHVLSLAARHQPGPVARMLIKLGVFAPLLLGAFALRYAVLLLQP
ncbi:MAG: hypothetical protein B7Y75_06100 [Azorhizobium sp. 35-67-5]|nr:MAG: hypothetical protein B7Y75_06100 [Azorhizobium sp. 35-67-5]